MPLLKTIAENKITRDDYIGLRVTTEEKNMIKLKAVLYTDGNVTAWLVYCALNHKPRTTDLLMETPAKYKSPQKII